MLERGIQSSSIHSSLNRQSASLIKDGQVIFAKVNKLLPEGMAEINHKGQKLIAKLEVPPKTGGNYLFQTELGEEGILKLKLISPAAIESKPSNSGLAEKLITGFRLPKNANVKEIISWMIKHSLPFSKEEVVNMNNLLTKTADKQMGIDTLIRMKADNLPVTKELYSSFLQGKSLEPISVQLDSLADALKRTGSQTKASEHVLRVLTEVKDSAASKLFQKVAASSSQILMQTGSDDAARISAFKLLQTMGMVPKGNSMESVQPFLGKEGSSSIQTLADYVNQNTGASPIRDRLTVLSELLTFSKVSDEKSSLMLKEVQNLLKNMESSQSLELQKQGLSLVIQGEKLLSQKGTAGTLSEADRFNLLFGIHSNKEKRLLADFSQNIRILQQVEKPGQPALKLLQQFLYNDSEGNASTLQKDNLPEIVRDLLSKLGVNHEAKLAAGITAERSYNDTLKPALVALLKELPQGETRDAAEKLLYKLNGQAILSGENGPLQQVVYQFPLSWLNQRTDVTMQWTGRKTDDGKIDSGFCRVLFYLELENIKEVVVDMAVQNRVIALNIYNETPHLKELSTPFYSVMKSGLEKLDYKLSALHFREPAAEVPVKKVYRQIADDFSYSGVDLRI